MAKCTYCVGTDVQHEVGEPCLWEQLERDRWEEAQAAEQQQRQYEEEYYRENPHG